MQVGVKSPPNQSGKRLFQTGFEADFYLSGRDPLHTCGLAPARQLEMEGQVLVVAPPEYVIVRKLECCPARCWFGLDETDS